jgi:hypothetical protein
MADVVLELVCGRCGQWWMRWTVDLDRPFEEQLWTWDGEPYLVPEVPLLGFPPIDLPGGYRRATDGDWYRWAPGKAASLPEGATYARYRFTPCPGGHSTDIKSRVRKLDDAAVNELRRLYDTRTPLRRVTVDKLLRSVL